MLRNKALAFCVTASMTLVPGVISCQSEPKEDPTIDSLEGGEEGATDGKKTDTKKGKKHKKGKKAKKK